MRQPSEECHAPEDIGEPQPGRESDEGREGVWKKVDYHTHEASEHNKGDEGYDGDIGDGGDQWEAPEIDDDNRKCENKRRETHRERVSESKPPREKSKYSIEPIPKKEEPKNRKEGELKTHVIIQNKWIYHHESSRDSHKERESTHPFPWEEDAVREEPEDTGTEDGHLWTDQEGEEPNTRESEREFHIYRKWPKKKREKNEDNRDIEPTHRDNMRESGIIETRFGFCREIGTLTYQESREEFRTFSRIDIFNCLEEFHSDEADKSSQPKRLFRSDFCTHFHRRSRIGITQEEVGSIIKHFICHRQSKLSGKCDDIIEFLVVSIGKNGENSCLFRDCLTIDDGITEDIPNPFIVFRNLFCESSLYHHFFCKIACLFLEYTGNSFDCLESYETQNSPYTESK